MVRLHPFFESMDDNAVALLVALSASPICAIAQALRFGAHQKECLKAIDIAFELAPKPSNTVYKGAMKTLAMVSPHCWHPTF